ncbi:MAG: DNA primase [Acetobacteraceae bacterium]
MALPPNFLDELRARTPLAPLIGRRVRLARSGRQWKGCCPFHGEKTPSFYVYDDHYHCFGCGAHGDAITFVMQSQGAGFMEAVEQLAAEAGLDVPKPSPEAAELERRRLDLNAVLEAAARACHRRLFLPEGQAALSYLRGRGLTEETVRRFGLGWSGEGRGALAAELAREGVTLEQLVEAGLMRRDDDSGRIFDLFYSRVMFPIRDRRGRTISFGGRILGDGQPKYLNGPETSLFSKRRSLYGLDLAREAVRNGGTLLVVEGYMDVIALHQAGFTGAVAPLGTALTEEQLEALWTLSPCPILCFDGDAAGTRAAVRGIDLALPMLTIDRSLKVVTLPPGEDPDSLLRKQDAKAFQGVMDRTPPLVDSLYLLLRQGAGPTSPPEQRAAFMARLDAAAGRISDRILAGEYRETLRGRFYAERREARAKSSGFGPKGKPAPPRLPLPEPSVDGVVRERARILTAILLRHPILLDEVEHAYVALPLTAPFDRMRDAILAWADHADVLDSAGLIDHLTTSGLQADVEHVLASLPVPLPASASPDAAPTEAQTGWWYFFGLLNIDRLRQEVAAAEAAFIRDYTPETQARHVALLEALLKAQSGDDEADLAAA